MPDTLFSCTPFSASWFVFFSVSFAHATWLVGSWFCDQRVNPDSWQCKWGVLTAELLGNSLPTSFLFSPCSYYISLLLSSVSPNEGKFHEGRLLVFAFRTVAINRLSTVRFSSVAQSCPPLFDPMDCSTPGLPVHRQLLPRVYSNSYPLSRWGHPTISSSVVPFSCLQSFPASGSFQMSQLFASGGQSIGVSASASVLPINIQDWFPLRWTGWISQ